MHAFVDQGRCCAVRCGSVLRGLLPGVSEPADPHCRPVAAGGSPDVLARLIGEKMRERLGQPVVVDNRAGAGQMIGSDHVAKSAPDGYTIMLPTATYCGSAAIQPKLPFDPVNDLTGVAMVGVGPLLVVVHPDRKSTRLNSSHSQISYAVVCLKKQT